MFRPLPSHNTGWTDARSFHGPNNVSPARFPFLCLKSGITSSPLYLGTKLENLTAVDLAIISNKDAIAVNQQWAGYAGDMLNFSDHGPVNISKSNYSTLCATLPPNPLVLAKANLAPF